MKTGFLDRIIERIDRLDPSSLQAHLLHLAKEKGLMETIFQAIQDGIVVLDGDGRVSYANASAAHLIGTEPGTMTGRPISAYLRGIDWDRLLDLDDSEWSRVMTHEIEIDYPEPRFLSFYVAPLPSEDTDEKGLLLMLRDITRDRQEAENMRESERIDAVKLLAAGVAHEIGNPLNALSIHLQLIDRELEDFTPDSRESIRELVDITKKEVSRLDMIITQFLRAIRPTAPNLVLCDIDEILTDTLSLLKHDIENREISVEIDSPGQLPKIRVDEHQMKQAFFNVAKNSLQAMPDGGKLSIALSSDDRFVAVSFQDSGHGITTNDVHHIFEPYYTTKEDGSGLGLMIVQRIVQDHGGAMEIQSKPGEGTNVTVLLPRSRRRRRLLRSRSIQTEDIA